MKTRVATIKVQVPGPLRRWCADAAEISLPAADVRGVLDELEQRHPELYRSICDDTGEVRRHVNLFVNSHHMRDCNGLETSLAEGDVVVILPAVSGG